MGVVTSIILSYPGSFAALVLVGFAVLFAWACSALEPFDVEDYLQ